METTLLWPFAVYVAGVLGIVVFMIGFSHILGQRHSEHATGEPYESGILSTGSARIRFSVRFYLIAILFVIFDLEVVFLFAWAIALRDVGWEGYIGVLVFTLILVAALVYEWRTGALDLSGSRRRNLKRSFNQANRYSHSGHAP